MNAMKEVERRDSSRSDNPRSKTEQIQERNHNLTTGLRIVRKNDIMKTVPMILCDIRFLTYGFLMTRQSQVFTVIIQYLETKQNIIKTNFYTSTYHVYRQKYVSTYISIPCVSAYERFRGLGI